MANIFKAFQSDLHVLWTAEQTSAQKEDFLKSWRTVQSLLPPFKPNESYTEKVGGNKIYFGIELEGTKYWGYLRS